MTATVARKPTRARRGFARAPAPRCVRLSIVVTRRGPAILRPVFVRIPRSRTAAPAATATDVLKPMPAWRESVRVPIPWCARRATPVTRREPAPRRQGPARTRRGRMERRAAMATAARRPTRVSRGCAREQTPRCVRLLMTATRRGRAILRPVFVRIRRSRTGASAPTVTPARKPTHVCRAPARGPIPWCAR